VIVTFAIDEAAKAEALFGEFDARMDAEPDLAVRLYADKHRIFGGPTPAADLVATFRAKMRGGIWPGRRRPEVSYVPRSVELDTKKLATLHGKAVVADQRRSLITSVNLTEAAQARNVELGVLTDDVRLARRIVDQFDQLAAAGALVAL
jgi:phosphatidylserine/phosphatidylglycerophosphate/cardiolipin synthase-like enzyme